jgi:hypothetical protein
VIPALGEGVAPEPKVSVDVSNLVTGVGRTPPAQRALPDVDISGPRDNHPGTYRQRSARASALFSPA